MALLAPATADSTTLLQADDGNQNQGAEQAVNQPKAALAVVEEDPQNCAPTSVAQDEKIAKLFDLVEKQTGRIDQLEKQVAELMSMNNLVNKKVSVAGPEEGPTSSDSPKKKSSLKPFSSRFSFRVGRMKRKSAEEAAAPANSA